MLNCLTAPAVQQGDVNVTIRQPLSRLPDRAALAGNVNMSGWGSWLFTTYANQFSPTSRITADGNYLEVNLLGQNQTVAGLDMAPGYTYIEPSHGGVGGGAGATLTVNMAAGDSSTCYAALRDHVVDNETTGETFLTLTKTGAGTLTLANGNYWDGRNSYAGGTNVNEGVLATVGVNLLGTGPVTVSGGTLSQGRRRHHRRRPCHVEQRRHQRRRSAQQRRLRSEERLGWGRR